jgi:RNA polymerase sigma-70 factor (ECF subfamily)
MSKVIEPLPGGATDGAAFVRDEAVYAAFLASHRLAGREVDLAHGDDLRLACACALGDRRAHQRFDARYLTQLPAALGRIDPSRAFADEVRQVARIRLLLPDGGRRPRIALYSGAGPLSAWTAVAVTRIGWQLRRRAQPTSVAEPDAIASSEPSAERQLVQHRHVRALRSAVRRALALLTSTERAVVRRRLVSGQPVEHIARDLGVSPATVHRWLSRCFGELRSNASMFVEHEHSDVDAVIAEAPAAADASAGDLLQDSQGG